MVTCSKSLTTPMVNLNMGKSRKPLPIESLRKAAAASEQVYECIFLF